MDTTSPAGSETPTGSGAPTPSPAPTPRLVRSSIDRRIAGVAGGLGRYFGVDPVLFRIGFLLLVFAGGIGLLAYLAAWFAVPVGDGATGVLRRDRDGRPGSRSGPAILGVALLIVGVFALTSSSRWFGLGADGSSFLWPVLLLGGGGWLLFGDRWRPDPPESTGTSNGSDDAGPTGGTFPSDVAFEADDAPRAGGSVSSAGPLDADDAPTTAPGGAPGAAVEDANPTTAPPVDLGPGPAPAADPGPAPSPPGRQGGWRGLSVTRLVLGALLLGWGAVAAGELLNWWDADPAVVLAVSLSVVGVGLAASGWLGRAWALVPVGLILALVLGVVAVADLDVDRGVGERTIAPDTLAELEDGDLELGIGALEIDLTGIDDASGAGDRVPLEASVDIGELRIVVPDDVGLIIEASSRAGDIDVALPGRDIFRSEEGFANRLVIGDELDDVATLVIDAEVGIGVVEVVEPSIE